MPKQKNQDPTSNEYIRRRSSRSARALLAPTLAAGALGVGVVKGVNSIDKSSMPEVAVGDDQQISDAQLKLKRLPAEYPNNVLDVQPDKEHAGLTKVTYVFTPGHGTISNLTATIAPNQDYTHAAQKAESYNNNSVITKDGQSLTVEVDQNGFIVENPKLTDSAQNKG